MALDKAGSHSLEFLISQYFDVHQLSASVRQKWEQATMIGNVLCTCSLEEISRRQQAAELNRLVSFLGHVFLPRRTAACRLNEAIGRSKRTERNTIVS